MSYIPIGVISNVHGIKGALKVKTDSDFKVSRYEKGNTLYIRFKQSEVPVTVVGYFEKKGFDILTFEEFTTVNEVEKYKGCTLLVHEKDRESLPEDEFYFSELIGKKVFIQDHEKGVIKEVREFPQASMLVIETVEGKRALVPFLKRFVQEVEDKGVILVPDAEELL